MKLNLCCGGYCLWLLVAVVTGLAVADVPETKVARLSDVDARVLQGDESTRRSMVRDDLKRRLDKVNRESRVASLKIKTKQEWEKFSRPKIEALRASLGDGGERPKKVPMRVTRVFDGEGFRIENVVFESRPGLWVTANLYSPAEPTASMPGIVLCHSHHRPKEQGELQDMGMTGARAGCVVLTPDHLGHGERRQHPFAAASDYAKEFRVSRQDYYFRYDTGMQLHLVGESLIGWMAWDLMRGVDLLLSRNGVDPERIILLGAVAGGGDPAGVTAAMDKRIACAVPFNFGGPQPETRFPLPKDAETSFNYSGSGGWESTRNLRRSAVDGFLPYVIVGGIAPRRLIFAHEFNWHRERDPVWKRLNTIYSAYDASDNLAFTHGRGELKGRPPEATHCTNIGPFHRQLIHEAFKKWFSIEVTPESEFSNRRETAQLNCMTAAVASEIAPKRLVDLLPTIAAERLKTARAARANKPPDEQHEMLKVELAKLLGDVEPAKPKANVKKARLTIQTDDNFKVDLHRVSVETEPGITVPLLIFRRASSEVTDEHSHVVIGLAQAGKAGFLKNRHNEILELIKSGYSVCLPDLRGTGETRPDSGRGRYSADTGRSSTELMLGGTTVGARLRDLRCVMKYLRGTESPSARTFTLWGDSFAPVNSPDREFNIPRRVDGRATQSEPLGGMLALLGALYEDDVKSAYVRGGMTSFSSLLTHQQVLIPHDVVVPGLLKVADLDDITASLAPRPIVFAEMVDHLNRKVPDNLVMRTYLVTAQAYKKQRSSDKVMFGNGNLSISAWLSDTLSNESN